MPVKKRKTYELDIIDLAFGGKGLAKPDGFPVFVDRCVPGDRVFVKIFKKKKSWAEGRLINIVTPVAPASGGKMRVQSVLRGMQMAATALRAPA
ncbi:TRAM domain-containing protein [uncultured Desulfobacter sp.]|uniref:TRAM domain-containing protein n=1 Tax=uncultured Desulfobacter sp. TaxID=240139 RepID=UPI002AA68C08|nr:TRAM domain-containing protein [uncultured Desulfobacter sp.]